MNEQEFINKLSENWQSVNEISKNLKISWHKAKYTLMILNNENKIESLDLGKRGVVYRKKDKFIRT